MNFLLMKILKIVEKLLKDKECVYMNYFKNILLTKELDNKSLACLLNKPMAYFYLGYLSQILNVKDNQILNANLKLIQNILNS